MTHLGFWKETAVIDDDPITPRTARNLMVGLVALTALLLIVFFFSDGFAYVGVR